MSRNGGSATHPDAPCRSSFFPPNGRPRAASRIERARPDALVWDERGQGYTYAHLARFVSGFARALRASSVGLGRLVGISCEQRFLHFALILACRVVGATSVSFSADDVATNAPQLERCDFLCLTATPLGALRAGLLLLRPDTIERIAGAPIYHGALEDERDHPEVEHLIMTSGTTGRPKIMASTRAMARGMLLNDMASPDEPGSAGITCASTTSPFVARSAKPRRCCDRVARYSSQTSHAYG